MDRRSFIGGAAALTIGGGAAAQPVPSATIRGNLADRLSLLCRVRPNIASLTAVQLTALKNGIAVMKSRPASNPTSWSYQAAMHGSNAAIQLPLFSTCQHGTDHFLSWHRLYLYYFERILRAASGSPSLMLPYWSWQTDRVLPAPFRDNNPANPLFTPNRNGAVNSGTPISASSVNAGPAMAATAFNSFSASIEGTPHGAVHGQVGGWMSTFATAGLDPIFWLHHCNVDRLWEAWLAQGGGRANRADAAWQDREFEFFDETSTRRKVKMRGSLATCRSFSYNYVAERRIPLLIADLVATQLSESAIRQLQVPRGAVETAKAVTLGSRVASATLELPRSAVAGKTYLDFADLDVSNPEGHYEIYLNPREGAKLEFTDPSYAGNLVLFGLTEADHRSMHTGHGAMADTKPRRVFDITRKLAALRKQRGFDAAKLRVVLVLSVPGGAPAGAVDTPRVRIGKLRLISQ